MSLLMELHEAHKARLIRMQPKVRRVSIPIEVEVEDRLQAQVSKMRRQVDALYEQVIDLGGTPGVAMAGNPTVKWICVVVSRHCHVPVADIYSPRRTAPLVRARQIAMYLAKSLTMKSLPEIARRIGDRDHTTVLHGVRKITALREKDADLDALLHDITKEIMGAR